MSAVAIIVSEIQGNLEGFECNAFAFKNKDQNWLKSFWKYSALTAEGLLIM